MNDNRSSDSGRRFFLQSAGALLVVAATAPVRVLGLLHPDRGAYDRDEISYTFRVADYPALARVGGSVKLSSSDEMIGLNPDHRIHAQPSLTPPRGRYPIAVTRVAEDGPEAFVAVSTFCTHGKNYQLKDYDAESGLFVCPHKGACFKADGTHVEREGTPDVEDLRRFPAVFDERKGTLKLTLLP